MGHYDVIIIGTGAGAGGGTLARHLAPSDTKILLIERLSAPASIAADETART